MYNKKLIMKQSTVIAILIVILCFVNMFFILKIFDLSQHQIIIYLIAPITVIQTIVIIKTIALNIFGVNLCNKIIKYLNKKK